jgi:hypothetical protein
MSVSSVDMCANARDPPRIEAKVLPRTPGCTCSVEANGAAARIANRSMVGERKFGPPLHHLSGRNMKSRTLFFRYPCVPPLSLLLLVCCGVGSLSASVLCALGRVRNES